MNTPYRAISSDCPWPFRDQLPGNKRGASAHYRVMPLEQIKSFLDDRPSIEIADDSLLFLWRVASMQQEALDVVKAWGFTVKSELVWVKTTAAGTPATGMGRYTRNCHETCLIATRGKASMLIKDHGVQSVFSAPRGEHSAKPAEFYRLVERLVSGPFLELFARGPREGWTVMGLEAGGANARIPLGKEIDAALRAGRASFAGAAAISRICVRFGIRATLADVQRWSVEQLDEVWVWLDARCKRNRPEFLDAYVPEAAE